MTTPTVTPESLAAELAALVPPPATYAPLPAGLTPGHRYAYSGQGRMGTVTAREDGALLNSMKSPVVATWATANADRLDFRHYADCPACAKAAR